jgi:hypothetical protein
LAANLPKAHQASPAASPIGHLAIILCYNCNIEFKENTLPNGIVWKGMGFNQQMPLSQQQELNVTIVTFNFVFFFEGGRGLAWRVADGIRAG